MKLKKSMLMVLATTSVIQLSYAQSKQIPHDLTEVVQQLKTSQETPASILSFYQTRSNQINPKIRAILAWDGRASVAVQQVKNSSKESFAGVPILVKDNIDVAGFATTAGSLALADNIAQKDATVVKKLKDAGAIIAGKANLSEWANLRSSHSTSGWSSAGGQVRNPYNPAMSPCGSSSGSGAAVAARLIPAAIGTETDGSIVCPASVNGIVGLKPTIGLVSRAGIIPLSHSQDTAGPMTVSVRDAALILNTIAGSDRADPATIEADKRRSHDYTAHLKKDALKGKRLGIVRSMSAPYDDETKKLFELNLSLLQAQGAVLVDNVELANIELLGEDELFVLLTEHKADLNQYLASAPSTLKIRSMADVIEFNKANDKIVMPHFGQEFLEQAQATIGLKDPKYLSAKKRLRTTSAAAIDKVLKAHRLDALIAPTTGVAWKIDYAAGDVVEGSASTPAAIAGYPHLTVPMGLVRGLPVGLSFFANAWSEANLLGMGYAFEQARAPIPLPELAQQP